MADGTVVSGHLTRGLNAVAVTFELLIEDAAP
jgi:hypothetical protein